MQSQISMMSRLIAVRDLFDIQEVCCAYPGIV
jgi:hypothetical protein